MWMESMQTEDIVAIATNRMKEVDPQVDDNMANNSVPRWNGAKLNFRAYFHE